MNRASWLLLVLVQLSCLHCYSATHHGGGRKHGRPLLPAPANVVVGSVVVVHSGSSEATTTAVSSVSGTLVGVRCHDGNGRTVFRKDGVVTDRSGRFRVHLAHGPSSSSSSSSHQLRSVTSCSVAVHLPQASPPCVATASSARGLHLVAHHNKHDHGGGTRVFSAGAFSVRPELCSNKGLFFPPVPLVPEPPNVGGVPIPPNPVTPAPPSLVPPLLPTPSPPSVLPPLVPQPPPSSVIPPLLPLVKPPPPPPPPQLLPPLVPVLPPGVPGVPPASASTNRRPVNVNHP
ncbi:Pollen Ole e 1 allergen and extensin family protein [Zea mays]|uniref:Pollen Ole e 1 allergen and extensin family protein n=1 Tax=Zea mays TaxID=4577 RepID=A0A1D6QHM4_MAIZE|nr:Pollen Ole e 1 allergen and extensin family protein [Zea mays]